MQINCKGQLLDLSQPIVMGIVNSTPDSFFEGSRVDSIDFALEKVAKMLNDGAQILDIGGASSRPGAETPSLERELERTIPLISALHNTFSKTILSIDTYRAEVARQAVEAGASMVNDISAGKLDSNLLQTVAALEVPYVLMHMQGQPKNMQQQPDYQDVVVDILDFFIQKTAELRSLGLKDIILDPGFGFGKSIEHNYTLLGKFQTFSLLNLPLLAGISRKSMLYKQFNIKASEALNASTAAHMIALQQGAKILRVHDVKEAVECIKIFEASRQN